MQDLTIYDIAEIAGVSPSTVSRVINNYPYVKESTRVLVQKVLKQYNYVPNETARGLVTQNSKTIGILISDIRTTHHTNGVYYIEREFMRQGYCCLIFNTGTDQREQAQYFQLLSQRKVEAAVLMGSIYQTDAIKAAIEQYLPSTPIVICNGYLDSPNVYSLITDEENGVLDCVKLLAYKGRQNLAFLVDRQTPSNLLKQKGFERGISMFCPDKTPVIANMADQHLSVSQQIWKLMQEHPQTNGIIFADDMLAIAGLRSLKDMNLSVPDQIAVIGINNSTFSENSIPTLTSLDNMLYDLSLTAARNLLTVLDGGRVNQKMMIFSQIVEREST